MDPRPTPPARDELWHRLPVALVRLDADGRVLAANDRARRLLLPLVGGRLPSEPAATAAVGPWWPAELRRRLARSQDFSVATAFDDAADRCLQWEATWCPASDEAPAHHLCVVRDASDDHRAGRVARAQAARLQWLADQARDATLYVDFADGRCALVNRAWAQAAGRPPDALLGRRLDDLIGADLLQRLQPALDRVRAGEAAWMPWSFPTAGASEPSTLDLEFVPHADADGQVLGCLLTARARPVDPDDDGEPEVAAGDTGADADADDDRPAFGDTVPAWDDTLPPPDDGPAPPPAAESAEAAWRRFADASGEGLVLQRDGVITAVNRTFSRWLGVVPSALPGLTLAEFLPPAPDGAARPAADPGDGEHRRESVLVDRHGRRRAVELRERAWIQGGEALQMTILRDLTGERAAQAHIRHLSDHDALTGLVNRPTFMQRLDALAAQARREGSPLALLFIDLDHFKRVNDLLGHPAGDALLRTVAQRLTGGLRSTDLVARFGGDEFMVLLPGRLSVRDVEDVARKLLGLIQQPVQGGDQVFQVTPSIGVALFPQDGDTASELIKNADTAMYAAKARGRAGVAFYDRDMGSEAGSVLLIESQLTQALARGELRMHLQPQVCARTGEPLGAEALIRWRHPQRGWVPPDQFVPVAEQQRLIVPIGEWMLREAVRAIRRGRAAGLALGPVGVNLATPHFEADGFVDGIARLLADEGVPGELLELELTERMLLADLPVVRERLQRLRAMGVRIAVDDFGTGYSSLGHLQTLPVDKLKLDRLFVKDLPDNAASAAILRAIVQMAHSLAVKVLVEGVETEAQRRFLAAEGVDGLQGHAISPPLPLPEYEDWLRRQALATGLQPSR